MHWSPFWKSIPITRLLKCLFGCWQGCFRRIGNGCMNSVPPDSLRRKRAALYGHVADCVSPSNPAFRFHCLLLHIFLPLYFIWMPLYISPGFVRSWADPGDSKYFMTWLYELPCHDIISLSDWIEVWQHWVLMSIRFQSFSNGWMTRKWSARIL